MFEANFFPTNGLLKQMPAVWVRKPKANKILNAQIKNRVIFGLTEIFGYLNKIYFTLFTTFFTPFCPMKFHDETVSSQRSYLFLHLYFKKNILKCSLCSFSSFGFFFVLPSCSLLFWRGLCLMFNNLFFLAQQNLNIDFIIDFI